jgi:DNA-binding NtrC family response regulator
MSASNQEQILLVDNNRMFRETLAQRLQRAGYQVMTAETGEQAFSLVRNWVRPVGWLYTRAALPRLVDGWILADAYHEVHPQRPVVISAAEARVSARDFILRQPGPAAVLKALLSVMEGERAVSPVAEVDAVESRRAA